MNKKLLTILLHVLLALNAYRLALDNDPDNDFLRKKIVELENG
jgi:hypothetical protein